jgi:broad specificity phosphatase PhoE
MTTHLHLLRHGPTAAPGGRFIGSTDVGLSGQGLERLSGAIGHLTNIDCWYASPMLRTRQTVDQLKQRGCAVKDVIYDARLQEIDFGRWEQKTFTEISVTDPTLIADWQEYESFSFPEGESVHNFIGRVREMLELFADSEHEHIAVMTHGGVIRTMISLALGISPGSYLLFDVQPASLTQLDLYDQGGVLRGLNL